MNIQNFPDDIGCGGAVNNRRQHNASAVRLDKLMPDDTMAGDAWIGIYMSFDGGESFISTLIPGYPQDISPEGCTAMGDLVLETLEKCT